MPLGLFLLAGRRRPCQVFYLAVVIASTRNCAGVEHISLFISVSFRVDFIHDREILGIHKTGTLLYHRWVPLIESGIETGIGTGTRKSMSR